jgi:hypothetical protein
VLLPILANSSHLGAEQVALFTEAIFDVNKETWLEALSRWLQENRPMDAAV